MKALKLLTVDYGPEEYSEERRKFERFALNLPTKLETMMNGQQQSTVVLSTSDISAGGVFLLTEEPISEGIPVKLSLTVSTEWLLDVTGARGHLEVAGKVVRCDSNGMAICFDDKYRFSKMTA